MEVLNEENMQAFWKLKISVAFFSTFNPVVEQRCWSNTSWPYCRCIFMFKGLGRGYVGGSRSVQSASTLISARLRWIYIFMWSKNMKMYPEHIISGSLSVFPLPTDTIVQHYINMVSTQCSWSPLYYALDRRTALVFWVLDPSLNRHYICK